MRMRIALLGTRGVPAHYGGFETAVEEVGKRLVQAGHHVTVYGKPASPEDGLGRHYLGMERVEIPAIKRQSMETLSRTGLSVLHLITHRRPDVAIVFNCANSPLLPLLKLARIPTALHTDGLEWRRGKWGPAGKRYYRITEALGAGMADELISDAAGIAGYYWRRYGAHSTVIPYGAPIISPAADRLAELELTPGSYMLMVARLEPENHVDVILRGLIASNRPEDFVVVGSVPYETEHLAAINRLASGDLRVRMLGGVWDQDLLDVLYAHAKMYFHGHSVGGTNPSLLRAMGAGGGVAAYDVDFNREVLGRAGLYWADEHDVTAIAESVDRLPLDGMAQDNQVRAEANYDWDDVATRYEKLCEEMYANRKQKRVGPTLRATVGKVRQDPELDVR